MAEKASSILVLSKNAATRREVGRILETAEFQVLQAATEAEALQYLLDGHARLVVFDVSLPPLPQLDFSRRLKNDPRYASVAVLYISPTPGALGTEKLSGPEPGADNYLTHPFDANELLSAVRTLLRLSQAEQRAGAAEASLRARDERISQLECEVEVLNRLAAPSAPATAAMFDGRSLQDAVPDVFGQLVTQYEAVMELALEQRNYKVSHNVSELLRALGEQLGFLRAGPRDIVDLHSAALRNKTAVAVPEKLRVLVEEGRFLILELMGHLVSYYRTQALRIRTDAVTDRSITDSWGTAS